MPHEITVHCAGQIWHTPASTLAPDAPETALVVCAPGALAVDRAGKIRAVGPQTVVSKEFPAAKHVNHGTTAVVTPGFIDAHVHPPQVGIIGSCHGPLLDWLNAVTFPEEARFQDPAVAQAGAARYVELALSHGTTTAAVFGAPFRHSVDALFKAAKARGMRLIGGKPSMDRGDARTLQQGAEKERADIEQLIATWHGQDGRLFVALTPRFALSCSRALLDALGSYAQADPTLYVATHWAESQAELTAVRETYPESHDYLAVYEASHLLTPRTLLAHGVHPTAAEVVRLKSTRAAVVHCPTSNAWLGSGIAPIRKFAEAGVGLALGTDVGAGTSLSLWRTMGAAYEGAQLRGEPLSPVWLFWLATRGGARVLDLGDQVGSFSVGKDADFLVLKPTRLPTLRDGFSTRPPTSQLAALMALGDDRLVEQVFIGGNLVYGPTPP